MIQKDLIKFEDEHPELQMDFLEWMDLLEAPEVLQVRKLESSEYWDYVEEIYNEKMSSLRK